MSKKYSVVPLRLGAGEKLSILKPYVSDRFFEQLKSVWLIIAYLILFQILVLRLPVVDAMMIGAGIVTVILGLMLFMEGLTLGLMPFGEIIGATLPRKAGITMILAFAFLVGLGATFAEPAISTLQLAGKFIQPEEAPLLYSLLNEFSAQLVLSVGVGVGIAVILGILRFLYRWSLKKLIIPLVALLAGMTAYAYSHEVLNPIIGLAWDCGAVTTGPVTVPLVLALGIGVSRVVSGDGDGGTGFGIVTLASLLPVVAVLLLGFAHLGLDDYYGRPNSKTAPAVSSPAESPKGQPVIEDSERNQRFVGFSDSEYRRFVSTGQLPRNAVVTYEGEKKLVDGKIVIERAVMVITKKETMVSRMTRVRMWDAGLSFISKLAESARGAVQAIVPLCVFLFLVLRLALRERIPRGDEIALGIFFTLAGMTLFTLGIFLALDPLGSQVGKNVSASFGSIKPYGMDSLHGPLFESKIVGQIVVIVFAFVLGYSATLAEPALNALGITVEKITVGAFKKSLLMQTVAAGVGLGIATGVSKLIYNLPLAWLLIPPYMLLIVLTLFSSEDFVNIAWDSAGVTTGPITVPLVLAMGLGIGATVNAPEGFGVLAMASVFPILCVLTMGIIVRRNMPVEEPAAAVKEI